MTKNILKTTLLALGAGSMLVGCDLEQPEAPCFVQDATNWYVKYDVVDEPKRADGTTCTARVTAERLGVYKFVDPDNRDEPLITIRPAGLAGLGARDSGAPQRQTATGKLSAEPDAEEFCSGTEFSVATADAAFVPAVPDDPETPDDDESAPAIPATVVTYEFSNVRVYSAPSAPGTQLTGELKYTRDGCTSTYVMRAIWPASPCIMNSTDAATNCGAGSGLNPDFAAECLQINNCGATPDMNAAGYNGCCIPTKAIPSFNASEE